MIETIYLEEAILQHPRAKAICERFPSARKITCHHYGEIFNVKAQNFRLQKLKPALILAKKHNNYVLPTPPEYGVGAQKNYYFSHMLNCLYDCRYCFLQGMFRSANYLCFVNDEDFHQAIKTTAQAAGDEPVHFFSGYDCDSLALEPVTGFVDSYLPVIDALPNAWLELRTKSTQIRSLLNSPVSQRCIVAFSFTPQEMAKDLEHKVPSINKRIEAMQKLQRQGWWIGLRFDPIIYHHDYEHQYRHLFEQVFSNINEDRVHSVSLGMFRLPEKFFKKMQRLYPEEKLFAGALEKREGMVSSPVEVETEVMANCTHLLSEYIPANKLFPCA
ncbi:MAG: DUF1848 family protein [Methylococcaceae bacterium]